MTSEISAATPSVKWRFIVPLLYIAMDAPQKIGRYLTIEPLTTDEKVWFLESPYLRDLVSYMAVHGTELKISGTYAHPFGDGGDVREEVNEEIVAFVTALRLLKGGDVGIPSVIHIHEEGSVPMYALKPGEVLGLGKIHPKTPMMTITISPMDGYDIFPGHSQYRLEPNERSKIDDLFTALTDRDVRAKLGVALRRFNQSLSRRLPEDKITDLTIAMEASLLYGVEDEFAYKLSLRGAALLAGNMNPNLIQLHLNTMYDARSKIVHEGMRLHEVKKLRKQNIAPNKFLDDSESVVREILRCLVSNVASGNSLEDILRGLDAKVVNALKPLKPPIQVA